MSLSLISSDLIIVSFRSLFVNNFFEVFFDKIKLYKLSHLSDFVIITRYQKCVNTIFYNF